MRRYFISLLIICRLTVSAQVSGLTNYTQEQGLDASFTYRINQDKEGFVWIGSDNGVYRFDGSEFVHFKQKDGLNNIDVLQALPMDDGSVFIAPFQNDFAVYEKGKIVNSSQNKELSKINSNSTNNLRQIVSPDRKSICILSNRNPDVLHLYRKGKVESYPININYLDISHVGLIYVDFDFSGNLYLCGNGNVLFRYNIYTRKLSVVKRGFLAEKCTGIFALQGGNFMTYAQKELGIITSDGVCMTIPFSKDIYWALPSGNRFIWVAFATGGVLCYDLQKDPQMKAPISFMEHFVLNDAMNDRDGNVWFSTKNNGIFFMSKAYFQSYLNTPIKDNSSYITAIAGNSNAIFLGYDNGEGAIYKNKRLNHLVFNSDQKLESRAIFANSKIALFGSTWDTYCVELKRASKIQVKGIGGYIIKNIVPYTNNSVLLCTSARLVAYNFNTGQSTDVITEKTYSALPYAKDSIFVGNFKDLYKYSTSTKIKKLFLKGYYFTDLKKVGANLYLGATNGNGLILFNNFKILRRITTADGLSNDQVKRVEIENNVTCWASTNSGLSRVYFNNNHLSISNFTRNDGLPSDKVSGCVIRNDSVYVGTAKGLAILPIKELLHQNQYLDKKVVINAMTVGKVNLLNPIGLISLNYPENNVVFNLSFLDYNSQGKVSYLYNIEGLNSQWQTSSSPKINLNALPPGDYTFKVYGLGYNGKRSQNCTALAFKIKPAFWQTWWFRSLVIAVAATCIFFLLLYVIQRMKNKKIKALLYNQKIAELELQAIKAQMNPHFIYNCLNSIQYLLYKNDLPETKNYLSSFTKVIRKTLHYSESTFLPIREEIDYLTLYLDMEKLRFAGHFRYEITVGENVNKEWKIPSLLIQPFVENSLKHGFGALKGEEGIIIILFECQDAELVITIRDNGVGFNNETELMYKKGSFGIKLSKKRIDTFKLLFNVPIRLEAINLSDINQRGTEIKLYLLIHGL